MAETPTAIPDEWRDPRHVMPHLAHQLRDWLLELKGVEHDLMVLEGALMPDGEPAERDRVLSLIRSLHGRMVELNHQVGNRLEVYVLIADELKRNGSGG